MQVADASGWNATFGMHRADFVEFLAANLPAGVVHAGHRAIGFEQNGDVARVKFANGATAEADVVVAADGIHSELRPYVFPPSKPVFHGTISYRGLVPRERLPDWPMDRWQMWAGPSKHFLVFPVRHGDDGQLRRLRADRRGDEGIVVRARRSRTCCAASSKAGTRASARCWSRSTTTFRWALYDREPLPTWTKGRLTLLGDAAHPMLPHLGQGANQSIEDGMALATILAQVDNAAVPAALLAYERLRRERVAEVQLGARQNGLRVDSAYADLGGPRRRARRARRIPQAAVCVRRGAGCEEGGGGVG